jgi:agmatinase
MFWLAWKEGLVANGSVHAGLRTRLQGEIDNDSDSKQGWVRIASDEIGAGGIGPEGIAKKIMDTIGTDAPVYLSVDIDVIDPGLAPATGTPEPGGWLTRELIQVLRGIEDLNVVGADLVEVAPGYDGAGEQTSLAAAQIVFELITSIVKRGLKDGLGGKSLKQEL